jgi:hypothetical protein
MPLEKWQALRVSFWAHLALGLQFPLFSLDTLRSSWAWHCHSKRFPPTFGTLHVLMGRPSEAQTLALWGQVWALRPPSEGAGDTIYRWLWALLWSLCSVQGRGYRDSILHCEVCVLVHVCVCVYILVYILCLPSPMGWCSLGHSCGIYKCRWDLQLSSGNPVSGTHPELCVCVCGVCVCVWGLCVCVCVCVCVCDDKGCT